ncbi:MAG: 3-deoxy-manno-octulosonate cytidylyltransferase [Bacteroidota bacterium]
MSSQAKVLGVIPARYASSRFPGKPLARIHGKTMIQRVYEQAQQAKGLGGLVVATDDERIHREVKRFGGQVRMTREDHESGTARLTEVATYYPEATHFLNIQGDEPYLHPDQLDQLIQTLLEQNTELATLARPLRRVQDLQSPHVVKVVLGEHGQALYFSRAALPYCRDEDNPSQWLAQPHYFHHVGLYGFTRRALMSYASLNPSPLESLEKLEQLRWLAHGYVIKVGITNWHAQAIDTPTDLEYLVHEAIPDWVRK